MGVEPSIFILILCYRYSPDCSSVFARTYIYIASGVHGVCVKPCGLYWKDPTRTAHVHEKKTFFSWCDGIAHPRPSVFYAVIDGSSWLPRKGVGTRRPKQVLGLSERRSGGLASARLYATSHGTAPVATSAWRVLQRELPITPVLAITRSELYQV